jgi:hypothetical protein
MSRLTVNIELETQGEIDALWAICYSRIQIYQRDSALLGRDALGYDRPSVKLANKILTQLKPMVTREKGETSQCK